MKHFSILVQYLKLFKVNYRLEQMSFYLMHDIIFTPIILDYSDTQLSIAIIYIVYFISDTKFPEHLNSQVTDTMVKCAINDILIIIVKLISTCGKKSTN